MDLDQVDAQIVCHDVNVPRVPAIAIRHVADWMLSHGLADRLRCIVEFVSMVGTNRRPGNVPAELTAFVGRRHELGELKRTLAAARLASLVGPGGVGKTRLALRATAELQRNFRHGAWLVELAELTDGALVPNALVSALDLRDQTAAEPLTILLSHLRDREMLIVLDNCEHLLVACASLASAVLKHSPGVRLIATSREPLGISGEHVLAVHPLGLPGPGSDESLAYVRQTEAVMLFSQRAAAASAGFEVTSANQAAVVELCRRLDGLPLAIELAAVRTRVLSVDQILERLQDRFALLTGGSRAALPRQQTLRTAIDWSYDLMSDRERAVLRRLAVFAGGFGLEGVEAVSGADGESSDVLDILMSLVDKSVVARDREARIARYRLHETMREYCRIKLREAGEEAEIQRKYAVFVAAASRRLTEEASTPRLVDHLAWIDLEIDNLRGVLRQCLATSDYTMGIVIVGSLRWYWSTRAVSEGIYWLDEFLQRPEGTSAAVAQAFFVRGFLAMMQAKPEAALPALQEAAERAQDSGDPGLLAQILATMSIVENLRGDHARALTLADEASKIGEDRADAFPLTTRAHGFNALAEHDDDRVHSIYDSAASISRERGDLYGLLYSLIHMGSAEIRRGELESAKPQLTEALALARRIDDRPAESYLLQCFGLIASSTGNPRQGARLFGAAESIGSEVVIRSNPPMLASALQDIKESLGKPTFEIEFNAGRELSRDDAIALALNRPRENGRVVASKPPAQLLGQREREIAALVAQGLSNKEIGSRLLISKRTVDTHIRNILNKLGYDSRTQIASWATSDLSTPTS